MFSSKILQRMVKKYLLIPFNQNLFSHHHLIDDDFLASLRCDGFRATLSSGRDAQNFFLQSGDVEVLDGTSPNTLFPVVLQSLTSNSPKGAKQSLKLDLKRKKIEVSSTFFSLFHPQSYWFGSG